MSSCAPFRQVISPALAGGDKGEGDTPTLTLPRQGGGYYLFIGQLPQGDLLSLCLEY